MIRILAAIVTIIWYTGCCCCSRDLTEMKLPNRKPRHEKPNRQVAVVMLSENLGRQPAPVKVFWAADSPSHYKAIARLSLTEDLPQYEAVKHFQRKAQAIGADALMQFSSHDGALHCLAVQLLP